MSAFANLVILSTENLAQLHIIVEQFPGVLTAIERADGSFGVNQTDLDQLEKASLNFWLFLKNHGQTPYVFKWSGYAMFSVLAHLKELGANLLANQMNIRADDFVWFEVDCKLKKDCIDLIKTLSLAPDITIEWVTDDDSLSTEIIHDAIKILNDYLNLVDERTVLLINIG